MNENAASLNKWNAWLLGLTLVVAVWVFIQGVLGSASRLESLSASSIGSGLGYLFVPVTIAATIWIFGGKEKTKNGFSIVFLVVMALFELAQHFAH